jgi:uncharacterized membrane protein
MASRVTDGAGSALDIGFAGFSRNRPILTLLLSLGPVLVPAIAGMFKPQGDTARRAVTLGGAGIATGLVLLYFVRISEESWVGFRAGQILLISIPILLARTIELLPATGRALLIVAVLIVGLPTTVIDAYNAQDTDNRRRSPGGFRWTLHTTPAQQAAFAWLRANTRDDDIVQMEPIVRAREHWTLIPSFAGRRMAAGQPISLMPLPIYQQRSAQVRTIFATADADQAAALSHTMGIDYLYVDSDDARAYPVGTDKFERYPGRFERVFVLRDVRIYRVR